MTIPQQLLTAFLILVSLPLVLKLLWKVRLLPLTAPLFFAVTASKGYIALYFVPPYIPAG